MLSISKGAYLAALTNDVIIGLLTAPLGQISPSSSQGMPPNNAIGSGTSQTSSE